MIPCIKQIYFNPFGRVDLDLNHFKSFIVL